MILAAVRGRSTTSNVLNEDTAPGVTTIPIDVPMEATEFGPLKEVLGAISAVYANYKVRL